MHFLAILKKDGMKQIINKQLILKALYQCIDPELNINIVDIGLIYSIKMDKKNNVELEMTMTSPMCPAISMILSQIQDKIESIKGIGKLRVNLVWDPLWNPDMMKKELKFKLNKIV